MKLAAGRELDALVAEKVMGWKWWKYPAPNRKQRLLTIIAPPVKDGRGFANHIDRIWQPSDCLTPRFSDWDSIMWSDDGFEIWQRGLPHYSTDIAAAWQVVEKLLEILPQGGIHIEHLDYQGWSVSMCFKKAEGGWDGWVDAETIPLAICLAALAAAEAVAEEA